MTVNSLVCSRQVVKMQVGMSGQRLVKTAAMPASRVSAMVQARRVAVKTMAVAEIAAPNSASAGSPQEDLQTRIVLVHSPQEWLDVKNANKDKLVVLECKATACRPCKAFQRKYSAAADYYKDSIFVEIYGDESTETRKMMKEMQIKVTPTFVLFRNGEQVHSHGGVNEEKFHTAVQEHLLESEAGYGKVQLSA